MSAHMKIHSNPTKFAKIIKKMEKKNVNAKNQYRPLEIQPTPFYLILILISWTYHPFWDIAYLIFIIEL